MRDSTYKKGTQNREDFKNINPDVFALPENERMMTDEFRRLANAASEKLQQVLHREMN